MIQDISEGEGYFTSRTGVELLNSMQTNALHNAFRNIAAGDTERLDDLVEAYGYQAEMALTRIELGESVDLLTIPSTLEEEGMVSERTRADLEKLSTVYGDLLYI
jgi:hypothetical protein